MLVIRIKSHVLLKKVKSNFVINSKEKTSFEKENANNFGKTSSDPKNHPVKKRL
jgi:hypothetical protein